MIVDLKRFSFFFRNYVEANDMVEEVADNGNTFTKATQELHDALEVMGHKFSQDCESYCKEIKTLQARTINKLGRDAKMRELC